MEKKDKSKYFKVTITFLFIVYISLYTLNVTGYYDGNRRKKIEMTESQIKEFEKDLENGEKIDIKNYLAIEEKDYTNGFSKFGYKVSTKIDNLFNKEIKRFLRALARLVS